MRRSHLLAPGLGLAPGSGLAPGLGLALGLAAGLGGAGCAADPAASGSASIVLDIPNGALDPAGYTSVEVTLHEANGDTVRSAAVEGGRFDLGDLDPRAAVSIEAVLRNDAGVAVGYGRTAAAADLAAGAAVTVQVRRPIVYLAGVNFSGSGSNKTWFGLPAAFGDLAASTSLDGSAQAAGKPALVVAAGPSLYTFDHGVVTTTGDLTGPATIRPVSTADHALGAPLGTLPAGLVQDGAGTDDGQLVVVGTTEKLYLVDARPGAAAPVRELAAGSFGRIAVITGADGSAAAVAVKGRVATTGTCTPSAELWWVSDLGGAAPAARMIASGGGFADVAADRGRAWYVDACKGELGEALPTGARAVRGDLGKPTALAVSNGQAWIGVEQAAPIALSILVVPVDAAGGAARTLWSEPQDQIVGAVSYPGVERRLTGVSSTFLQLEIGAGGAYVAATTANTSHGVRVSAANFPEMDIETRELRVFDAASGGSIERYLSWCFGTLTLLSSNDISPWRCATSTGQLSAATGDLERRLSSMTFLFGKK